MVSDSVVLTSTLGVDVVVLGGIQQCFKVYSPAVLIPAYPYFRSVFDIEMKKKLVRNLAENCDIILNLMYFVLKRVLRESSANVGVKPILLLMQ